ncbi:MAG: hypothetical protein IT162_21265 [Bryobacterales bacterium]|nr:hypothetical protein [Bryobacterales bacterium]
MLFAFPLLAAIQIVHTGFEGARLERVEPVTATHFRAHLRGDVDQDGRNRQANWYSFRIDGARGQEITIDLTNLPGEYNYRANRGAVTKDTVPVWSEDNLRWTHFATTEFHDDPQPFLRLKLKPTRDRVWIAHVPPYTNEHLARLEKDVRRSPHAKIESAGRTPQGRAMPLWTFTDAATPDGGKRVVWLMFRQHAWETGSSWAGEGAVRFLLSAAPDAARIRRATIFKIFPRADPAGVARGNVRFNAAGFDLNRNWDVDDAAKMPEIAAQKRAILAWVDAGRRVDLFLSLHNTETSEYLEAPPTGHDELGARFFAALAQYSTFAPTRPLFRAAVTTTEGKPGRMNVLQGLHHARQLPAFLMEQMIARNPKLGDFPNVSHRTAFGAGLVRAAAAAVLP